ncbi:MAG: sulfite exporter TauE/SafE family protein [Acidimicrobiia bacterium]
MSDVGQFLVVVLVGVGTGILSGMFGVGGAIVSTPAIRALGATPLEAVGSTLPSVIPSAISGTLRYAREGLIRWEVFRWTAGFGIAAAVGGALLTDVIPGDGHPLMLATAALLAFTAFRLARPQNAPAIVADAEPHPPVAVVAPAARTEPWRCAIVGVLAGTLSGLLGIGGGLFMVPAFTSWLRLPLKSALGTSLACVGILAIPGLITHALLGHVDWYYAIPLSIGVIPGAQIGAHLAIVATERTLRITVATVLGFIAIVYFTGELLSLVR